MKKLIVLLVLFIVTSKQMNASTTIYDTIVSNGNAIARQLTIVGTKPLPFPHADPMKVIGAKNETVMIDTVRIMTAFFQPKVTVSKYTYNEARNTWVSTSPDMVIGKTYWPMVLLYFLSLGGAFLVGKMRLFDDDPFTVLEIGINSFTGIIGGLIVILMGSGLLDPPAWIRGTFFLVFISLWIVCGFLGVISKEWKFFKKHPLKAPDKKASLA